MPNVSVNACGKLEGWDDYTKVPDGENGCYPMTCVKGYHLVGEKKGATCERDAEPTPTPEPKPAPKPDEVTGTITGKDNAPVSGASISVYKTENCVATPTESPIKTATTGEDGTYSMVADGANCIVVSYENCTTAAEKLVTGQAVNIKLSCEIAHENVLTEAQKKGQIEELEKNAKAMKDKEQSTANKLIGAAGIGLTGAGLRNTMEGMAEMQLDENATQSMKAYLQTFRCNYGGGSSYKGGEENIELPGAGALMPLVTEYKTLAAELKETKLALDMKPGIESQEILDSATMGLHDDERHGIESGAFTSVSRALLNEDGEDAAAWAKQQDDAKHKRNQGLALAAAGAVGSAVASGLVNKKAPKEDSATTNAKYDSMRQTVMEKFGMTGTATLHTTDEHEGKGPSTCENKCYDATTCLPTSEETACRAEPNKQWNENKCECEDASSVVAVVAPTPQPATCTNSNEEDPCTTSGGTWNKADAPNCKCDCPEGKPLDTSTHKCTAPVTTTTTVIADISNGAAYQSGSIEVQNSSKIEDMINTINSYGNITGTHKIYIFAHTDPQGIKKNGTLWNQGITTNQVLSDRRAEKMQEFISNKTSHFSSTNYVIAQGCGDTCFKQRRLANTRSNWDKVRRVHVLLVNNSATAPTCASICADGANWN